MSRISDTGLPLAILDILPNPVLVKGSDLRYVWVNKAFENLFAIKLEDLIDKLDTDAFPDRQAAQCNAGDKRVLSSGEIDEAYETIYKNGVVPRVTITRKSRLTMHGKHFLVGVMHDITDITEANDALEESKQQLQEQSIKLQEMAYTDPLTGVMNRRRLEERAGLIFGTHHNHGCAMLCDLDHFKRVNDRWGHDAGDAALVHFVEIVKSALREDDFIARIGGEEFVCLLPGIEREQGLEIAERIRALLENSPLHFEENRIDMTVSIGMTLVREDESFKLSVILSRADDSMYQAKNGGRNQVIIDA